MRLAIRAKELINRYAGIGARLKAVNGHFDTPVLWNGQANVPAFVQDPHANVASPAPPPPPGYSGRRNVVLEKALDTMDRCLSATVNDKTSVTEAAGCFQTGYTTTTVSLAWPNSHWPAFACT
jgi:hypothetical protein